MEPNGRSSDGHNLNAINENVLLYCICRSSESGNFMIQCDFCAEWYHGDCIGVTKEEAEAIDKYSCLMCRSKNPNLKTTHKTNSVRSTAPILQGALVRWKGQKKRCRRHKRKRPNLKTTHKTNSVRRNGQKKRRRRHKRKHPIKTVHTECEGIENLAVAAFNQNSEESSCNANATSSSSEIKRDSCFGFVDTTIRKAKTEAYGKFRLSTTVSGKNDTADEVKPKMQTTELRQCYGPGCTRVSRKNSKYCSDKCGMELGKNRIIEILPQRLREWVDPSAADELSYKKLNDIRSQLTEIKEQFDAVDIEIIKLIDSIIQSKQPENNFVEEQCDDTTPIDCNLCGTEIPIKFVERHLEHCYKRSERKISITECTSKPTDSKWNIFCNHKVSKNMYCKKMRVLCPFHYRDFRKDDEVCGYNLGEKDGIVRYCGNVGRTCSHLNWEETLRAELDQKKLNLLNKVTELKNEEVRIRQEMARRGDLLSLLLNSTITH